MITTFGGQKYILQGTATRTPIEPDRGLVSRSRVRRWEEPEEQLASFVEVARDRKQTSIGLANIEVDLWDCCTIDFKFCDLD